MADSTIKVGWEVDFAQLRDQLRASGTVSEKSVKDLVNSLRNQYKKAEDASAKSAKKAAAEWEKSLGSIKGGAEKLASIVGGPVADLSDIVFDLGEKVGGAGSALGAAGLAAGGTAIAFAAVAYGSKAIADAAVEAAARLDEQGRAAEISPEARASLALYEAGSADLRGELDLLIVQLGSGAADALGTVAVATGDAIESFRGLASALSDTTTTVGDLYAGSQLVARVWTGIVSLGASEVMRSWASETHDAAEEHRDLAEQLRATKTAADDLAAALEREAAADEAAGREELRRQQEAAAKAARAQADAERELVDAWREFVSVSGDVADDTERIVEAHAAASYAAAEQAVAEARLRAELAQIEPAARAAVAGVEDLEAAFGDALRSGGVVVQAWGQALEEITGSRAVDATLGAIGQVTDALGRANEERLAAVTAERDQQREAIDARRDADLEAVDRLEERGRLTADQAEAERAAIQERAGARRAENQREAEAERAALLRGWRRTRAAQIAAAGVDAFRAGVSLIPAFAYAGAAAPALAAGVAAAGLAAAVAGIQSIDPPEFPMGRLPSADHTIDARIRPDEAIANPRGTQSIGVETIERANRGQALGPTIVQLAIDGRVVDERVGAALDRRTRLRPPGSVAAGKRSLWGR